MLYTLKNQDLTVTLCDAGAELISVKGGDCEYIWTATPPHWNYHAPLVFPVCGRFQDGQYDYDGKTYTIDCHGVLRYSNDVVCVSHTDTSICFRLTDNEKTRAVYPFPFCLNVWYILDGNKLTTRFEIENTGDKIMPATCGFHPGFNVPLDGKGSFEDCYIEFDQPCYPDKLLLSERYLYTGKLEAYDLEDARIIRLRHDLFDDDAIFFHRAANRVILKSTATDRKVTLVYPDAPYVGLWHTPHEAAPFVCIEPWFGVPGLDSVREDLATRSDMFRILPGAVQTAAYDLIFE